MPTAYHRSKLRRYFRPDPEQTRLSPAPAPLVFEEGRVEYEVEEVLDHREVRGKRQYLLQWKGTSESSWEWETNMHGCMELLQDYLQKIGEGGRVLPPELTSVVPQGTTGGSPPSATLALSPPAQQLALPPPPSTSQQISPPLRPPSRRSTRLRGRGNP